MSFTDVTTFVLFRFSVDCQIKRAEEAHETGGGGGEATEKKYQEDHGFQNRKLNFIIYIKP